MLILVILIKSFDIILFNNNWTCNTLWCAYLNQVLLKWTNWYVYGVVPLATLALSSPAKFACDPNWRNIIHLCFMQTLRLFCFFVHNLAPTWFRRWWIAILAEYVCYIEYFFNMNSEYMCEQTRFLHCHGYNIINYTFAITKITFTAI